jgi:hypothetical protein
MIAPPAVRRTLDPAKPVGLTKVELEIARLTTHGKVTSEMARGGNHVEGWPLTLEQAAKDMGYKVRRARTYLDGNPLFNAERSRLLKERRQSEDARNLATMIAIRDNEGNGLAADRAVQLKAVQAIEGNDKAPAVTVNVNQQNNVASISPGYVIRMPAPKAGAPTIDHEP